MNDKNKIVQKLAMPSAAKLIEEKNLELFSNICSRERAPYAVIGTTTKDRNLRVVDPLCNQTIIDLQDAEAVIPSSERIPFERLERGNRIKALITEIRTESKGIPIVVSRNRAEFVQRMLELEVPELTDGTVELRAIAREAGSRTKIAVFSNDPNVDPKGACVGSRGSRVRQIVNELKGEKLDVVEWREDKVRFIIEALGPADIDEVILDEDTKSAKVIVKDSQLSLAIGKEGQNARLAAKLTGYKIDIEGLGDSPPEEEEPTKEEE